MFRIFIRGLKMEKNVFFYLDKFKYNVINIIYNSYNSHKKIIKIDNIIDLFIKWYLNSYSVSKSYIPDTFNILSDLEYAKNKYILNICIQDIQDKINKEILILKENISFNTPVNIYKYYPIFSITQYNLLKKKYTGTNDTFNYHLNLLSELYSFMGGINNHLSVPPELILDDYFELFGTPINTKNNYCSPFQIEKDYFNSYGSFFDFQFFPNCTYIANPPFDETIMYNMSLYIINRLDNINNINIIIILPKWDNFKCYNELIVSKYMKNNMILKKNIIKFYNYYNDKYVNIVDCYALFLTNNSINNDTNDTNNIFTNFINKWKNI